MQAAVVFSFVDWKEKPAQNNFIFICNSPERARKFSQTSTHACQKHFSDSLESNHRYLEIPRLSSIFSRICHAFNFQLFSTLIKLLFWGKMCLAAALKSRSEPWDSIEDDSLTLKWEKVALISLAMGCFQRMTLWCCETSTETQLESASSNPIRKVSSNHT